MGRLALLALLLWPGGLAGEPPCDAGTFREAPRQKCVPCDLCDGDHREYVRRCNGTANALCRCRPGFPCGGAACQRCPCPAGEEPTAEGCRRCPDGTFNNRAHGRCRPWSRCPEGQRRTPGTKERDVVCEQEPGSRSTAPPAVVFAKKLPEGRDTRLLAVTSALAGALLLCLLLFCAFFRSWARETFRKGPPRQLAQEVDDCTYCHPEEEEGGGRDTPCLKGEPLLLENLP